MNNANCCRNLYSVMSTLLTRSQEGVDFVVAANAAALRLGGAPTSFTDDGSHREHFLQFHGFCKKIQYMPAGVPML